MGSVEPHQPEFVKLVFKKMKQLKGKCYEILDPRFIRDSYPKYFPIWFRFRGDIRSFKNSALSLKPRSFFSFTAESELFLS